MMTLSRSIKTILALALAAAAGGGCTKAARTNHAVDRADRLFQAGEYGKAEVAYSNAVMMVFPRNPRALAGLGLVYAAEGRQGAALALLEMAAKANPDNAQVQSELANIWATAGRTAEAKDAARLALKLQPGNEKALVALCDSIRGTEDAEQTRRYIQQLQKQDQDRGSYHLALGMIDVHETNLVDAESEFNTANKLDPKSSLVYVALARLSAFHNNIKGAEDSYKTAVQLAPLRSPVRLLYAEYQFKIGATNEAAASMVELSRQAPDYLPPLLFLMKSSFEERKFDDCESFIAQVLAHEPANYDALLLKAEVSLEKKDGKQAVEDFTHLFKLNPNINRAQDQYQFAQANMLNGDRPKALSCFTRALELDSNYIPARLMLADLNMTQGNSAAAISLLTPLLKQTNLPPITTLSANLMLAQSYLLQKAPAQAIAIYRGIEASNPREAQIPFLEGRAWASENNLAEARAAFEKSLATNSEFLPSLDALVDLDLAQSRFAPALERVKKYIDKDPKAPVPWLLQARIHIQQKENAQAQAELEKVIALNPKLPDPYVMLANLYVSQNQQKQALDKLNALVALTNSAAAWLQIGMIHDELKEYDQSRQAYEKLLDIEPDSLAGLNNLAVLYADRFNKLDQAYELAGKEQKLYPQEPHAADTLGWILYKRGDYPRALALLRDSQEKQPADAEVNYHLGMTHYALGEEESARLSLKFALSKSDFEETNEAIRCLKTLDLDPKTATAADRADLEKQIEKNPADSAALIRLAGIQERDGEFEKAGTTYEKLIKQSPQNTRAAIRLALLDSTKLNQPQEALKLAQNAYSLAPGDPVVNMTLGRMKFQTRDFQYALSLLQEADRLQPSQPDLLHDLAWAYFSVGKAAEARASMQKAVQTGAPFAMLNDAKQFIEMTAAYGNPPQSPDAARVQQVLQADTNYAPALMAGGLIQEQQGKTKEAEQSFEKVLAAYPLFAPANRQLAILYARDGANDTLAYDNANKAAKAFPDDADLAKVVGLVEYRRKNYSDSLLSLTQSARNKQDDAELFWYQGMDYYALKKPADAKKALQRAVELKLPADLNTQATNVLGLLK